MSATVLVVDDHDNARSFMSKALKESGHEVLEAATLAEANAYLDQERADIILLDVQLPDGYGPNLLERAAREQPGLPIILITAYGDVEMAVEAMKAGAMDFLQKPVDLERLKQAVERASGAVHVRRELAHLRRAARQQVEWIIGETPAMKRAADEAARAARASVSVLISGETGTGKEVLARAIHSQGPRSGKPFVPVNCAAVPETLIESELFGHEAGAFTTAQKRKPGLMEVADGGVLFLDEISSLKMDLQVKLLRVLDDQQIRRVGGVTEIKVDTQIIAASNRDLPALMKAGHFREDLYYRLRLADLHLPPLRERKEDIPALVGLFLRQVNMRAGQNVLGASPRVLEAFKAYDWPGNIRELRHVIERAMLFCDGDTLEIGHLSPELQALTPATPPGPPKPARRSAPKAAVRSQPARARA